MTRARTQVALGNLEGARGTLRVIERVMSPQTSPGFIVDRANGHARLGEQAEARRLVELVRTIAATTYVGPDVQAFASLAVGENDAAAEHLELAIRQRVELRLGVDPVISTFIRYNFWSNPVLEEPRFVDLRRRLGEFE